MRSYAAGFCVAMLLADVGGAASAVRAAPSVPPAIGGIPWGADGRSKLGVDLDAILLGASTVRRAHVGVVAVDTATGTVLYERHADEAFQPASTLKLVVGSATLDLLGPAFTPWTAGGIERDGTIEVLPNGDPFFSASDIDSFVTSIVKRGVTHADDVVVDTSMFSPAGYPGGWTFDDFAQDYAAFPSPAVLDENVVHLHVTPSNVPGGAPIVDGRSAPLVATSEENCSPEGAFIVDEATTASASTPDTLDASPLASGCRAIVGAIPAGGAVSDVDIAIPDPPLFLARAVVAALRARGVTVAREGSVFHAETSSARAGELALYPGAWMHLGSSLRDILPKFWIPSDNFVGELLLYHLGGKRGEAASRPRGLDVERDWLRSIGVDPATTTLADGSGLSQYDRITPSDLVTILQHDWNGPNRQLVLDALPIGGVRGTIEGIAGTDAAGRVFAKTGSMMHVRGLAGYLATKRHGAVTFAFEVDDWIGDYPALAATRAAVLSRIIDD